MPQDPEEKLDAEGIPVLQDTVTSDGSEAMPAPSGEPHSLVDVGTTAAEEVRGETLRERLRQEEPEWRQGGRPEVGQLVEPGTDDADPVAGIQDDEAAAVATAYDDPDVAPSPEEAAMHVVDEP